MSKNKNIIIAIILIIVGFIGVSLCTIPSISKEHKVIKKYVSAINNCNIEKIKECLPLEEIENMIDADYEDLFGSYSSELSSKLDFMEMSDLSACSGIPEDVKEIKRITLISTNKDKTANENAELLSSKTFTVNATIKVTYITSDDKIVSFTTIETFQLLETSKGCKIISA